MAFDKESVIQKLCQEISVITRRELAEIKVEESLRNNGIDSMSFLEILLFIKSEWNIDYLNSGLPADAQRSVEALAEHICEEPEDK